MARSKREDIEARERARKASARSFQKQSRRGKVDNLKFDPEIPREDSFLAKVMLWLNARDRLFITYAKMQEDPTTRPVFKSHARFAATTLLNPSMAAGQAANFLINDGVLNEAFQKHWNSEDARNFRHHNLHMFEPIGRGLYTMSVLEQLSGAGKNFMGAVTGAYPISEAGTFPVETLSNGQKVAFQNFQLLRFLQETYASDAAKPWIRENGPLMIDLPVSVLLNWYDPAFEAIFATSKLPRIMKMKLAAREMAKVDHVDDAYRVVFEQRLEGADFEDSIMKWFAKEKDPDKLYKAMMAYGLRPESVLSRVAPTWFRPAGKANSVEGFKLLNARNIESKRLARLFETALYENAEMAKHLDSMKDRELIQFYKTVTDEESLSEAYEQMLKGAHYDMTDNVVKALELFKKNVDADFLRRNGIWAESLPLHLERADRDIQKLAGKAWKKTSDLAAERKRIAQEIDGLRAKHEIDIAEQKIQVLEDKVAPMRDRMKQVERDLKKIEEIEKKHQKANTPFLEVPRAERDLLAKEDRLRTELMGLPHNPPKQRGTIGLSQKVSGREFEIEDLTAKLSRKKTRIGLNQLVREEVDLIQKIEINAIVATRTNKTQAADLTREVLTTQIPKETVGTADNLPGLVRPAEVERFEFKGQELLRRSDGSVFHLGFADKDDIDRIMRHFRNAPPLRKPNTLARVRAEAISPGTVMRDPTKAQKKAYLDIRKHTPENEFLDGLGEGKQAQIAREHLTSSMEKISRRFPREAKDLSTKLAVEEAVKERTRIWKTPAEKMGGMMRKMMVYDEILAIEQMLRNTDKIPPRQKGIVLKAYDFMLTSAKQGMLFFRPGFFMQNWTDNSLKTRAYFGKEAFKGIPKAGIDGEPFVVTKKFSGYEGGIHGILDLPVFSQWKKRVVEPLNDAIEQATRSETYGLAYKQSVKELADAGVKMPIDQLDRHSRTAAAKTTSDVQFFSERLSGAALWIDRVFPFFSTFTAPNLRYWARVTAEHPIAVRNYLMTRKKLREASTTGDGKLNIPGTDVYVDPLSILSIEGPIRAMERASFPTGFDFLKVPRSENEEAAMAPDEMRHGTIVKVPRPSQEDLIKIARSVDSLAGNLTRDPAHARIGFDLLSGNFVSNLEHLDSPQSRREVREMLFKGRGLMRPVNDAAVFLSGLTYDQYMAKQGWLGKHAQMDFEDYKQKELNLNLRAMQMRGENVRGLEAERIAAKKAEGDLQWRTAGFFFGLDVVRDEDGLKQNILDVRNIYNTIPDKPTRVRFFEENTGADGRPILMGIVSETPWEHPSKELIEEVQRHSGDPNKVLEIYQNESSENQKGLLENVGDVLFNAVDKVLNAITPDAEAAEVAPEFQKHQGKTPSEILPIPEETRDEIRSLKLQDEMVRGKWNLTGTQTDPDYNHKDWVPRLEGGRFDFETVQPWARGEYRETGSGKDRRYQRVIGKSTPEAEAARRDLDRRRNVGARVVLALFDEAVNAGDRDLLNDLRDTQIVIGRKADGSVDTMDTTVFFDGPNGGKLASAIRRAQTIGTEDLKGTERTIPLYGLHHEFANWAITGQAPSRLEVRASQKRKQKATLLSPWLTEMKKSTVRPDLFDPRRTYLDLLESIESNEPGSAPKTFFTDAMDSEQAGLLRDFFMANRAQSMNDLYNVATMRDQNGNIVMDDIGINWMISNGFVAEAALLAQKDRRIGRELESRGIPTDLKDVGSMILSEELEKNDVDITPEMVARSAGALSPDILDDEEREQIRGDLVPSGGFDPARGVALGSGVKEVPAATAEAPIEFEVQAPKLDLDIDDIRRAPSREFRSTNEMIQFSMRQTQQVNQRAREMHKAYGQRRLGMDEGTATQYAEQQPRFHVFQNFARNLPHLPVTAQARGARDVMAIGNSLGFIDDGSMRAINRGIQQAQLQDTAEVVATNAVTMVGSVANFLSGTQKLGPQVGPPTAAQAKFDKISGGAGAVGSALSFAGGVAASQGEEDLATGLSTAGGAIQGAILGAQIGGAVPGVGHVTGAAIGAIAFGALGFSTSKLTGGGDGGPSPEQRDIIRERRRIQAIDARERREERRTRSLVRRQRELVNRNISRPRDNFRQLTRFFRRPQFGSSSGLVRDVDRRIARNLSPRF